MEVSIALAFSAGLLATINPCGFAMLPAYLSYFVAAKEGEPARGFFGRAAQGLIAGGVVAAGFVAVFGGVGLLIAIGLRGVMTVVPWLALAIGLILLVLGLRVLSGRYVGFNLPAIVTPRTEAGYRSVFMFGLAYATASLSCTLPTFLSVVGTSATVGSAARVPVLFLVYSLGVTAILFAISISASLAREGVARLIRMALPWIQRASGLVLTLAGAYIVFYWSTNLSEVDPQSPARAPIRALERLQSVVASWLAAPSGTAGALVVLALALVIWGWIWWRRTGAIR